MHYTEGSIGRVFLLKFDHGEDFQSSVLTFCREKNIRAGQILFQGALKESEVVVGPKDLSVPPEPMWKHFNDGREVLGFGTLFWHENDPSVHMHSVCSRGEHSFIGCIRKQAEVYLVIEAVITEFTGVRISRKPDPISGFALMHIEK